MGATEFVMNEIEGIFDWLRDPESMREPLVARRGMMGLVEHLAETFAVADPDQRKRIYSSVKPKFSYVFFMYCGRMAVEAVKRKDPQLLRLGTISLAIENLTFDARDSMIHLAIINHSATNSESNPTRYSRVCSPCRATSSRNF
jgi:hypothetical protein